jgi:hypothetical protein
LDTRYETAEFEDMTCPGSFLRLKVTEDSDECHLVFASGEDAMLDLPLPPGEAWALGLALMCSARQAIRSAWRRPEQPAQPHAGYHHPVPPPSAPAPAIAAPQTTMTPYGRRELETGAYPAGRQVRGEPDPQAHGRKDTCELPVVPSRGHCDRRRPGAVNNAA